MIQHYPHQDVNPLRKTFIHTFIDSKKLSYRLYKVVVFLLSAFLLRLAPKLAFDDFGEKQCEQKKSPNVYKSSPKLISLEK